MRNTSWSLKSKLVESEGLSTSSNNSFSGLSGESQGANGELWNGKKSLVVGDGGDSDDDLACLYFLVLFALVSKILDNS